MNAISPLYNIRVPQARCSGIWIVASCQTGQYSGKAVISHVSGAKEIVPLIISNEIAAGPSAQESVLLTVTHYHLINPSPRDYMVPSPARIYAQCIPIKEKSAVSSIAFLPGGAVPILYAITLEHTGRAASTADVEGMVSTPEGTPVPDALAIMGPYRTVTDHSGRFRFQQVVPDDYTLHMMKLGYYPARRALIIPTGIAVCDVKTVTMNSRLIPVERLSAALLRICFVLWLLLLCIETAARERSKRLLRTDGYVPAWMSRIPAVSKPFQMLLGLTRNDRLNASQLFGVVVCIVVVGFLS